MSITSVLHVSPAGRSHGAPSASLPSLSAKQEYALLMTAVAAFLAGSTGVALYALSALGQ